MNVYCDGASNKFTKFSGIGVVWFDIHQFGNPLDGKTLKPNQKPVDVLSEKIDYKLCKNGCYATNNEAEYMSLIRAMEHSVENEMENINVFMDSKLVVNQVNGSWKINFPHLQLLKDQVDTLRQSIGLRVTHVRREYNTHADKASKDCYKTQSKQTKLNLEEFKQ